jgi:hypothetical protein
MVSVVINHTRFSLDKATAVATTQAQKYDAVDRNNNNAAVECLLDSVSPELKKRIRNRIENQDPLPKVWLEFISLVVSTSIDRYEEIKRRIQGRHPSQYAGQDIVELVEDFSTDAKTLTMAGHFDHSLTLHMLLIFLKGGGDSNEAFRFPLRALHARLEIALQEIAFKDKVPAQQHMDKEGLLYTDICKAAETVYRRLKDSAEWPPAKHAQDSKAPPMSLSTAQIMTLMQNGFASGGNTKPGICNYCKKQGHWKKECPELKGGGKRQGGSGGSGHHNRTNSRGPSRGGNRPSDPQAQRKGWRFAPPAAGDPAVKHVPGNTKPFRWCGKCGRWTTTHDTATHTGSAKPTNASPPVPSRLGAATQANMFLVPDPSAWTVELPFPFPASRPIPVLAPMMQMLPTLLLAMMFSALITVGCVLDATIVKSFIASQLSSLLDFGWVVWEYRALAALLLWKALFLFSVFWTPTEEAIDIRPRRVRRAEYRAP